jgi:hypothetical protein
VKEPRPAWKIGDIAWYRVAAGLTPVRIEHIGKRRDNGSFYYVITLANEDGTRSKARTVAARNLTV